MQTHGRVGIVRVTLELIGTAVAAGALAGLGSSLHCAAMCGPLAQRVSTGPVSGARRTASAEFAIGKIAAYGILGATVGTVGHAALVHHRTPTVEALIRGTIAVALAVAAWKLARSGAGGTEVLVQLTGRPMPWAGALRRAWGAVKRPVLLGMVSAFLPCGALWTALLIAASYAYAPASAAVMVAFGIIGATSAAAGGQLLRVLSARGRWGTAVVCISLGLTSAWHAHSAYVGWTQPGTASCH